MDYCVPAMGISIRPAEAVTTEAAVFRMKARQAAQQCLYFLYFLEPRRRKPKLPGDGDSAARGKHRQSVGSPTGCWRSWAGRSTDG